MRLGGSLALPISTGFEFFHILRGVGMGCGQNPPLKAEAFFPLPERGFSRKEEGNNTSSRLQ